MSKAPESRINAACLNTVGRNKLELWLLKGLGRLYLFNVLRRLLSDSHRWRDMCPCNQAGHQTEKGNWITDIESKDLTHVSRLIAMQAVNLYELHGVSKVFQFHMSAGNNSCHV